VVVGDAAGGRYSVCCLRRDRLVAVESVNNPRDHMAARRLLAGPVAPGLADLCDPSTDLRALAVGSTAA
jgi:3-phenylpropionate/trans-cinnamate dioxygenase ferredoxin reductase subunit